MARPAENKYGVNLGELAREHNINYRTMHNRLTRGWSLEDAINTPVKEHKFKNVESVRISQTKRWGKFVKYWSDKTGVSSWTITDRMKKHNITAEQAATGDYPNAKREETVYLGANEAARKYNIRVSTIRYRMRTHNITADEAGLIGPVISTRELAMQAGVTAAKVNYLIYSRKMSREDAIKILVDNNDTIPPLYKTMYDRMSDAGLERKQYTKVMYYVHRRGLSADDAIKAVVDKINNKKKNNINKNKKKKK